MQENLDHIIESLLFVSEAPLTVEKLKHILETADTKEIQSALQSLAAQYDTRGGGFKLAEVAGGWQLRSRPEYHQWIKRMLQPPPQRLSKAALETLAIVAYNQPIIRADIEHIRGVDCGGVLRQLLERKLVRVLGRKEIPGRPLIYATTKLFLELFELKDLKDLPSPKEIEELSAAAEEVEALPASEREEETGFESMETREAVSSGERPTTLFSTHVNEPHQTPRQFGNAAEGPDTEQRTMPKSRGTATSIAAIRPKIPADRPGIGRTRPLLPAGRAASLPGAK